MPQAVYLIQQNFQSNYITNNQGSVTKLIISEIQRRYTENSCIKRICQLWFNLFEKSVKRSRRQSYKEI